jgi:hypothetical protein
MRIPAEAFLKANGEGGIRTHGKFDPSTDFKSADLKFKTIVT